MIRMCFILFVGLYAWVGNSPKHKPVKHERFNENILKDLCVEKEFAINLNWNVQIIEWELFFSNKIKCTDYIRDQEYGVKIPKQTTVLAKDSIWMVPNWSVDGDLIGYHYISKIPIKKDCIAKQKVVSCPQVCGIDIKVTNSSKCVYISLIK